MATLNIRLFGRLSIDHDGRHILGLEAGKLQELVCYLLLHRTSPQPREALASLLWGDYSTAQSKKCLRQALWQIQTIFDHATPKPQPWRLLLVEADWVQINPGVDLWLDVATFEQASTAVAGRLGRTLDEATARMLQDAVLLYQDELLEGWYQDWCLYERERLQGSYLALLDQLVDYCEARQMYDLGRTYAGRSLRYDPARERAHRQIMRLAYLAGDRTAALRQYQQCAAALQKHLGVLPEARTLNLYEQICSDQLRSARVDMKADGGNGASQQPSVSELLGQLRRLHDNLAEMQRQVQVSISLAEQALRDPDDRVSPSASITAPRAPGAPTRRHLADAIADVE